MKTPSKPKPEFWVTNVSNRNVTLADLACSIKAFTTVNLADMRRYGLTMAQLQKSEESGSLFLKRNTIIPRNIVPPKEPEKTIPILHNAYIASRTKSVFEIKEVKYEELEVSDDKEIQQKIDEQYASENADLELSDTQVAAITSKKV